MTIFKPTLIILLLLSTLFAAVQAKQFVQCSVRIDGTKTFKVDSIYPDEQVYLEVDGLASSMGWRAQRVNNGRAIRMNGKMLSDFKEYQRQTYISADEFGRTFGYKVKTTNRGLVVDFWSNTGATASQTPELGLSVVRKEETTSPNPEYDMHKLTVGLKNPSAVPVRVNARYFVLVDDDGGRHKCEGKFDVGVPARQTVQVERVYFSVPRMSAPKELLLTDSKGRTIGSTRF